MSAATCTLLAESTQAQLVAANVEGGVSCGLSNDACDCDNTFEVDATAAGTYPLDGDQVLIEDEAFSYCISGDRLEYGDAFSQSTARRN